MLIIKNQTKQFRLLEHVNWSGPSPFARGVMCLLCHLLQMSLELFSSLYSIIYQFVFLMYFSTHKQNIYRYFISFADDYITKACKLCLWWRYALMIQAIMLFNIEINFAKIISMWIQLSSPCCLIELQGEYWALFSSTCTE